jgi:AraC family transcriptional regulator
MSEQHRLEYLARIHRAQDYIERHLAEALSLEAIAREACFSPYHFHRIYSAVTGETLYQFILRLRLERAKAVLRGPSRQSVTEIALDCGFGSSAAFARAFRQAFGTTASAFRTDRQRLRKGGEAAGAADRYGGPHDAGSTGRGMTMTDQTITQPLSIEVTDLPARTLAYVRHVGPYAGDSALFAGLFGRLAAWAGPRDLLSRPDADLLAIYHDDPEITEAANLRVSVGVTVPPGTPVSGEVSRMEIPAGRYVQARFELRDTEYAAAWAMVMGDWLPRSGYQCDDRPHYEAYRNDPRTHPEGRCVVDLCVPIRPL